MKPLDIKPTPRPSREMLTYLLTAERGMIDGETLDNYEVEKLVNELLALRHGAEELAHKWRTQEAANMVDRMACIECADQLDRLLRGET